MEKKNWQIQLNGSWSNNFIKAKDGKEAIHNFQKTISRYTSDIVTDARSEKENIVEELKRLGWV